MGTEVGPPLLPSFNLPPQVIPDVPDLPRPNLDMPKADLPSFKPMFVPAAFISVAATLTATSLFKQCVKVFKPLIMQLAKRIQKKFTKNDTSPTDETPSEA